jgi:hypothetical protein
MKWYNYKHFWVDIAKCYTILLIEHKIKFIFYGNGDDYLEINYKNKKEFDAEFAKIKLLMGIEDYTSRCC